MNWVTRQHSALPAAQHGAVVLILLLIIAMSTAAYFLVHELNNARLQIEQDKINTAALAQARDAVLGFALANQDMPGGLPFPDRRENNNPNYDGNGDCVSGTVEDKHLLGKFPFLDDQGCGPDIRAFGLIPLDASGERLWYATAKHLAKSGGGHFPIPTNTSTLMASSEWLRIVDESGAPKQVAFILIAPGGVLPSQNRTGTAPKARNYLDQFTLGASTYDNANGTDASSTGFIAARQVNDSSNHFNDRLLYVTRDEFINRLVWRISGEVRIRLDQYHKTYNRYPFAAPAQDGECHAGTSSGFLPITDTLNSCGSHLGTMPSWWSNSVPALDNKWQEVTSYTYMSDDKVSIKFNPCQSVFTITWNAPLNRSEMLRSGPC